MTYILKKFPLPPTINKAYKTNKNRSWRRSDLLNEFLSAVDIWSLTRRRKLEKIHKYFMKEIHNVKWIQISMYIHLEPSKLYTKGGKLKTIDASNRIKSLHDALSDLIKIDDKHFSIGSTEFILSDSNHVTIVLKSKSQMTKKDLENELKEIEQS